ncbi:hypothetical protein DOTSEDRAFT_21524 [Dothistroma septosporum NZE10]|uniref:Peptidase M43 pregnancy-associated plasma-A domain-containing protein n=1 Tax=Dothistroma septosporum (strain NZE10 / CBS 128990) TaxID=675120 RepID=N1PXQ5_DOTSN|nr:hypothetical protein DOTSEDRAFT_21524 [Dothistroma septosporum NZE10]
MNSALHQASYSGLNLYFTSGLPSGLLRFCYFPVASPILDDLVLDGCMCLAASLPNGTATHYDLGYTAVHETGHWFGLYHVFQGLKALKLATMSTTRPYKGGDGGMPEGKGQLSGSDGP